MLSDEQGTRVGLCEETCARKSWATVPLQSLFFTNDRDTLPLNSQSKQVDCGTFIL